MRILAIDPGISTGLVLWDSQYGIIEKRTIVAKDPLDAIAEMVKTCRIMVMEEAPFFGAQAQARRCDIIAANMMDKVVFRTIRPSEWKPFAKASKWQDAIELEEATQHEKDAYCIARYYHMFKIDPLRDIK